MKRHKMVNLCPTSFEIAAALPNFSQWVRSKLIELDERNTFKLEYHMWCPEHPEYVRKSETAPRFGVSCTTCNLQMEGKWVQA